MTWLSGVRRESAKHVAIVTEAQGLLSVLSWNSPLRGFSNGANTTLALAGLLSKNWIGTDMVNMMMDILVRH